MAESALNKEITISAIASNLDPASAKAWEVMSLQIEVKDLKRANHRLRLEYKAIQQKIETMKESVKHWEKENNLLIQVIRGSIGGHAEEIKH